MAIAANILGIRGYPPIDDAYKVLYYAGAFFCVTVQQSGDVVAGFA